MSGQILDEQEFTEEDSFVLDKVDMAGWRGGFDGARDKRYRLAFDDHSYDLQYFDQSNYISYTFDAVSWSITEHRTTLFPQGKMTLVGSGECSVIVQP
jgi:hypothetical protein